MKKLLLIIAVSIPLFAQAELIQGKVVGVSDGDTITILNSSNTQYKIRLSGIDSPKKKQAFGQKSKENLSRLVFAKIVNADCAKKDRYQRFLCKIIVNGVDANLEQLKDGFSWLYKTYQRDQIESDRQLYANAEDVARGRRKGLWSEANPIEPWEFRKMGNRL